ncbi:peptidylprolyl isomerase [Halofilum ochraceum]|uniref:peptidylprolyl isomerase n=1 Tax=Halofilum ochraceum TaxID=1611323 RepID=UPI0008DA3E35|nr:peptidylprolyl isomerase [Halofilum ochraceum]
MIHRSLTAVLAVGALALTACGGESGASTDQQSASSAPDAENVVARVNGEALTAVDLQSQIQAMSQRGQGVNRDQALQELIELELMSQKAEAEGLPEQPEIAATIERQRASLLAQHLIRSQLQDFEVSEEELRAAYEERTADTQGTEYKARHILLEEKEQAEEMIQQLDDGAEFAELAKNNSTGPTKSRGGDLGWFSAEQMVEPFMNEVKALEPGNYTTEPVETQYGWHVIQLDETREAQKPGFEQMKRELRNELVGKKIQDYVGSLRDDAEIEITDGGGEADSGSSN